MYNVIYIIYKILYTYCNVCAYSFCFLFKFSKPYRVLALDLNSIEVLVIILVSVVGSVIVRITEIYMLVY